MNAFILTVRALWWRELVKFVRDRARLFGALAQPLAFWILLGLGFHRSIHLAGPVAPDSYLAYLLPGIIVLTILFTAIFSTMALIEERRSGLLQALLVAPVARTALVLGYGLGGTTLALLEAILLLGLLPLVNGARLTAIGLIQVFSVSLLAGLAFALLGFVVAWRSTSTRGYHAVMNVVLLPLWALSGAVFPIEGAAPVLQLIMRLNPVTYMVSALRQGLFGTSIAGAVGSPEGCLFITGLFTLALLLWAVHTVRNPLSGNAF